MTPRERMLRTMRGGRADRVPLDLPGFAGRTREDALGHGDPRRREIALRVRDHVAFSNGVPSMINRYLVTPPQRIRIERQPLPSGNTRITGVIDTPLGELTYVEEEDPRAGTTWLVKRPVESPEGLRRIASVPWELPEGLDGPKEEHFAGDFAERGLCVTHVSSPMVCVSHMMGFQDFLELTATDLDLVLELTEICRVRVLDCLKVLLSRPGIDVVWLGGSEWVTPPMGSPALYDAVVQEQERSIIDYVHAHSSAVVHLHCHGRLRAALPKMIDRGCDYTEPVEAPPDGDVTMAQAKRLVAGRMTLGGNVECRMLCNEDDATVERATRAAFEGGKERFVLRPSEGPSPVISGRECRNWMKMVDVWEELSPIE